MTLAESVQGATAAFREFVRVYRRSQEISKWSHRSQWAPRRWRRWVARYVLWCLQREVRREIKLRQRREAVRG